MNNFIILKHKKRIKEAITKLPTSLTSECFWYFNRLNIIDSNYVFKYKKKLYMIYSSSNSPIISSYILL